MGYLKTKYSAMKVVLNFLLALLMLASCPAQVVDRMVAVVNRQVILESEWEEAGRIDFLLQGKPLELLTSQEMDTALDRLIDLALLQQQIVSNSIVEPSEEEIAFHIRELRSRIPGAATDEKWHAMIITYGVTEQDVAVHVASQLRILKFVDLRFRALTRVDRAEISRYYNQTLLPELRKQGAPEPPLNQVSDKIQQVLTEQHINESLNSWLQAVRSQAHIEKMADDLNASARANP